MPKTSTTQTLNMLFVTEYAPTKLVSRISGYM